MILAGFGPTWITAYRFGKRVKMEHEIVVARPPVLQQVGGAGGAFDAYGPRNYPIASSTVSVKFNLSADSYEAIGFALDDLKAATIDHGEDKLWALHRDDLIRRWAWAKCVKLTPPEAAGKNYTSLPVTLEFSMREGLWYGERQFSFTRTSDDPPPPTFSLSYFGRQPGLLRAAAKALSASNSISFHASSTDAVSDDYVFTLAAPTLSENDALVAMIAISDASADVAAPDGWELRYTISQSASGVLLKIFTRAATASEPSDYSWYTVTGNAVDWVGAIAAFSGANAAAMLSNFGSMASHGSAASYTATGITTQRAHSWLLVAHAAASAVTHTAPGGMIERLDFNDGGPALTLCTEYRATAGATGNRTGNLSGSSTGAQVALELFPAGDAIESVSLTNVNIGRAWQWAGIVAAGDELVVDPAAFAVTNGGVDAFGGFSTSLTLANQSDSIAWMWLQPGYNTFVLGITAVDYELKLTWWETFT
ncbi:MAG TPA: hypothetical protein VJG32_18025 [Anaerolineae bacterium]|nr:hypothetical protein [Anaerolineae bacterium]